ncbi:pyrroloquinoline quinone biosynthesis peptide chaperone PqqD [Pelomicrobium sp.]|jgi:pyrroloquinoline quinone biosynthesis protein D|uniref:pyrroloquinoline quinone biosynthesis peptide chaperone PqqD n=1 Tax=Pelomicrobium sp. TaxID=2815319 RepID=UPI002FDC8885
MSKPLVLEDVPRLTAHFRLQWEEAQQAWVLLYPEGMVRLSPSAAEIMRRVDGTTPVGGIVADLERAYPGADLRRDVMEFLEVAHERGWIRKQGE